MEAVDPLLAMLSEARALKLKRDGFIEQGHASLYDKEGLQRRLKANHPETLNVFAGQPPSLF